MTLSACASTTVLRSEPSGATVYIDGSKVGKTPYTYSDTKIVGASTQVRLKLEGYEEFQTILSRSEEFQVGPCIGGVFVLVPFLWVMGYRPEHSYELSPLSPAKPAPSNVTAPGVPGPWRLASSR